MSSEPILTNRQRKELHSLDDVKGRRRSGLFVAEGTKCVLELAVTFKARYLFARPEWLLEHGDAFDAGSVIECGASVLREITRLGTTPPVIACFELPPAAECPDRSFFESKLVLALDRVQDPGNLGTILRTCDWMGVRTILATHDTVDAFNPKTVQATMGALARVRVVYCDLVEVLSSLEGSVPVYGTFLDGDNIYSAALSHNGVVVMGNEGSGISEAIESHISRRLYIPPYPADAQTVESLNVGSATAIVLSEFRGAYFRAQSGTPVRRKV